MEYGTAPMAHEFPELAELHGIRLQSLAFELSQLTLDPPYDFAVTINPGYIAGDTSVRYDVAYVVSGTKDGAQVLTLECTYQASYGLPDDAEVSRADIEDFGASGVLRMLHPYLRELVADVSARAGLPPITLGSMRLP
jgi:preprotein translocase subunit SecB